MAGEKENIATDYATPWKQENKLLTQNLPSGIKQIFLKSYTVRKRSQVAIECGSPCEDSGDFTASVD
jgi:hypothetical protein